MPTALVVGGTGPTGPHVVGGLRDRGFQVTILHRGVHEPPGLEDVAHLHADPHFAEALTAVLEGRSFDVVVAMYGRTRHVAAVVAGRCEQFVAVGGIPVYAGFTQPHLVRPFGLPVPVTEDSPLAGSLTGSHPSIRFARLMEETEQAVFAHHPRGACFRYPVIYGPRNPKPWEWSVVKRVRDRRMHMILPDSGMSIHARCAAANAAAFVLAAVDHPQAAAGHVYNVADDQQFTLRQWVEAILGILRVDLDLVAIPSDVARVAQAALMPMTTPLSPHSILDTGRARSDLGYRDVVPPLVALAETVHWYETNPVDLATVNPSYADHFDYDLEDRLIERYRAATAALAAEVEQPLPRALHGMPHPKEPGSLAPDHEGR